MMFVPPFLSNVSHTNTSRLESGKGSGLRIVTFITVKITVLAATPNAKVKMATVAKPGFLASCRNP